MVRTPTHALNEHLRRLSVASRCANDGDMLRRYQAGDSAAFAEIVHQYGPMVYGVCRRILGHAADADDAFQATFLALVRNPSAVRQANSLPPWLHRVALRTARKAFARRKPYRPIDERSAMCERGPADDAAWADVRRALDEELNRLPARLRGPLVLCYLDGATRDEAAGRLGLSIGTLDRRLATGRALLRARLSRRGLGTLVMGLTVFADGLDAAVPGALTRATAELAYSGSSSSVAVQSLVAGSSMHRLSSIGVVAVIGALSITVIGAAGRTGGDEPGRPLTPPPTIAKQDAIQPGEPLPDGAIARMGSTRLRHVGLSDFTFIDGGKAIATLGVDPTVRYWNPVTGLQARPATALKMTDGRLALSRDGKMAASCTRDHLKVWDIGTGKELASLAGPKNDPGSIDFSPDCKMICVASWDCKLTVWDWRAGTERKVPIPQRPFGMDSTFHGTFSPDGKHFAGGGGSGQPLCLFDAASWAEKHRFLCSAAVSTFTPDNKGLVVCSMSNDAGKREVVIRMFDVASGKQVGQYPLGHEHSYFSLCVSPDGKVLGCGCSDQSCLVDLTTGKVLHKLGGRPWGLGFAPDGKTFAATSDGTHLRLWDVATGVEQHKQPGNFGRTVATAISPNGRLVAAADWMDQAVHVWDATTGKRVGLLPLKGENRYARDLAFSTDGRTLAAGLYDGTVQVWTVATGKEERAFHLGENPLPGARSSTNFSAIRFVPNQQRVATLEQDLDLKSGTRVKLWDAMNGKPIKQFSVSGESQGRAWSVDGSTLVFITENGALLIDLDACEERGRLEGVSSNGPAPALSPDGRLVAARRKSEEGKTPDIGVYEVATGKPIINLPIGLGEFAISADNRTLITTDATHLRAWDLSSGKEVASRALLEAGTGTRGRLAVTRIVPLTGRRVFTPLTDGTALVWDLSSDKVEPAREPDQTQLTQWWTELLSENPARAYAAVWQIADAKHDSVVSFLRQHLRPEGPPDAAKLRQLIADLDSDKFPVRERADKALQDLGHSAVPALKSALAAKLSPEATRRIEQLLARKHDIGSRPEQLRRLRAMQILERLATKEANQMLAEIATGLPLAPETLAAQAALARSRP